MDFTFISFNSLLLSLKTNYINCLTFKEYLIIEKQSVSEKKINNSTTILRHDIDRLPQNALKLAQMEYSVGIKGTYNFRVVPESYNLEIINKIAKLGHEIAYHYEDVNLVYRRLKRESKNGLIQKNELINLAYKSFCKNLDMFRKNFDIKTICMHGSPRAKYDNRIIWEKYNYRDLGIIGEPYYDIDFKEFAYFTDTGRRWNGHKVSIRDKVNSRYNFNFKTTQQIIDNIAELPDKVMFTIHPERWQDSLIPWTKELIYQNIKNLVKRAIILISK